MHGDLVASRPVHILGTLARAATSRDNLVQWFDSGLRCCLLWLQHGQSKSVDGCSSTGYLQDMSDCRWTQL